MKKVVFIYDFDKTLSPCNMQEFGLIQDLGYDDPKKFWKEISNYEEENQMDLVLSYLYNIKRKYKEKMNIDLTSKILNEYGKSVKLFPGVTTWFERLNEYARSKNVELEHYILSSGMKEIIEGTSIAKNFKKIYASSYLYDESGKILWPKQAVNYTCKTQFIFRINKGALDVAEHQIVNAFIPKEKRAISFQNIAYFGDGESDVPCMKIVIGRGGYAIGIFSDNHNLASDLVMQNRVTCIAKADYSKDSKLEQIAKYIIDKAIK